MCTSRNTLKNLGAQMLYVQEPLANTKAKVWTQPLDRQYTCWLTDRATAVSRCAVSPAPSRRRHRGGVGGAPPQPTGHASRRRRRSGGRRAVGRAVSCCETAQFRAQAVGRARRRREGEREKEKEKEGGRGEGEVGGVARSRGRSISARSMG